MFGSHLSIAGNMSNALREAESLKMDTVQVFTKNQQQWRVRPLDPGAVNEWTSEVARLGWQGRAVAHASYLINLASPDDELWRKSVELMTVEIERCETLAIPFLVHHPGAFTTSDLETGLRRIAAAYQELFRRTAGYRTISCLENTAGAGSTIGRTFEELARLRELIIEASGDPGDLATTRVGYCFDTCHAHAAGYDLSSEPSASAALTSMNRLCGLKNVRVVHLNDSKGACGSRLDRHEHIGKGTIGLPGFGVVVNRHEWKKTPKILETPKGKTERGLAWDTLNLRRLRRLGAAPAARTPTRARERL